MRIAQIVCVYLPYRGGIATVADNFSRLLADKNNQITIFTPQYSKSIKDEENNNTKIIRVKPLLKYGNGAFIPQIFSRLKDFDIIYLHYPFFGGAEVVWLVKILKKKKIKLAIHFHMDVGELSKIARILSLPSNFIKNSLFKKADIITCASLDYVEHSSIKKIFKKYPKKFEEIPFGVDINKFVVKQDADKKIDKKTILFVGGLDEAHNFKGIDVLLESFSRLKDESSRLLIVGEGNLKTKYINIAKNLNIEDKVIFTGSVDNNSLIEIYQKAYLTVLPSISSNEAFGLVLLESMSCGTPVIASNLPGVRSVFRNNIEGLLVEPGSVNDLKEKISYLIDNPQKTKIMGDNARKLIENKYSLEKLGEKLNNLIKINENMPDK